MRLMRSQMLEVVRRDFVRTARARGLADRALVYRRALANSRLPMVTLVGWWGGRKFAPTVSDSNTFMGVWLTQ